jgi:protein-S-isoprenylcysteine O-methyltransferase Ste14
MYALLFLTIYVLIYYFIIYKKTKHLDLTKETINMFKTDFQTSFYISVFFIVLIISLVNYVFFINSMLLKYIDILGVLLILFSGIIEYKGITTLKENYYPQIKKEKYLVSFGIYKYIRHPIYLSAILLGLGILILFSYNLLIYLFPIILVTLVYKIESEEKYLEKRFTEYKLYKKTNYKIIPYIY